VAGHVGAAVTDTSASLPDAIQANTPDTPADTEPVDALQCTRTDLAAHFRVAVSDTWVSRSDTKQAKMTELPAAPVCRAHCTRTDLAGHIGAAVIDTRVNFSETTQANRVKSWLDGCDSLASFSVCAVPAATFAVPVPASTYPPNATATRQHTAATIEICFRDLLRAANLPLLNGSRRSQYAGGGPPEDDWRFVR
jgi:hypothetical protein